MGNITKTVKKIAAAVKKTIKGEHELKETLEVDVWYPDHEPRTASSQFNKSRHQIIDVEDQGCYICGSKENRELHHWVVEWAYAEAIDWDKVKKDFPNFDWANFKQPVDFVDGARENFMVLCKTHHTKKDSGIHMLPYPIWIVQKYVRDDFDLFGDKSPS